jgi:hypothetical protein
VQEREEKQKKLLEALRESPREEGQPRLVPRQAYRDPERLVKPTHASKVGVAMMHDWYLLSARKAEYSVILYIYIYITWLYYLYVYI